MKYHRYDVACKLQDLFQQAGEREEFKKGPVPGARYRRIKYHSKSAEIPGIQPIYFQLSVFSFELFLLYCYIRGEIPIL